jgi:uncharacterized repeat protein (TIGR03803 family)
MKTTFAVLFAMFAFVQPVSAAETVKFKEKVLYSFCSNQNCTDGARPTASLIDVSGTLYGTTGLGGIYNGGSGTVFALNTKTGTETVVYSFCAQMHGYYCLDGKEPQAGLIRVNGTLYGTTTFGGNVGCDSRGCGTVFSLDPGTGTEVVLHNFGGGTDGAVPYAGVISVKGILYGTTFDGGGSCDCGTVFSLDPATGTEAVLHAFAGGTDGAEPFSGLTHVNGKLYGTVRMGGSYGAGAIFSIDLKSGQEKLLYSFCAQFGCPDGGDPETSLIELNGALYGTTDAGGNETYCPNTNNPQGCGIVFSFDPQTGTEKVLFAFCNQQYCTDGWGPEGNLVEVNGTLYGTTYLGGQPAGCDITPGCGTVFSINLSTGAQKVRHSFATGTGTDGVQPVSGLLAVNGKFYGTTLFGGAYNDDGVVFVLKQKRRRATTQ